MNNLYSSIVGIALKVIRQPALVLFKKKKLTNKHRLKTNKIDEITLVD
jgi:hypothetical protein